MQYPGNWNGITRHKESLVSTTSTEGQVNEKKLLQENDFLLDKSFLKIFWNAFVILKNFPNETQVEKHFFQIILTPYTIKFNTVLGFASVLHQSKLF